MRWFKLVSALVALTALTAPAARAEVGPPWGPATPNFNDEVILRPVAGGPDGFGLVKFRQPKDADKIIYLDLWVRDLVPNHDYYLQRAVDTNVDDICTGTNWATLGQVSTDASGTGRAELQRDLTAIPLGVEFDIHFRVVDKDTTALVLESGCYQFVVSQ
jgi:hypothetical protein